MNSINLEEKSEIMLYLYFLSNSDLITCNGCCEIPFGENNMYRIKNTELTYCKKCFDIWIINKGINPTTGIPLNKKDIELSYEINRLIVIYMKYKKLDIKDINICINLRQNKKVPAC